jgi:hypothetical protein
MARLRQLQTNFASGELDPLMHFRVDTGAFKNGARRLRNAILYNSGGAGRRPGTWYTATLVGNTRLVPFEFASDERYLLGFSNGRLDVFDTNGILLSSVTSGCNWTTATLFKFAYDQSADTMIVVCEDWAPQVILRTGPSTFTVTNFQFATSINSNKVYQPYYKFANDNVTISCSATTGSVTVTASAAAFVAGHVGTYIRWKDVDILITAYTSPTVVTGTILGTLVAAYDNNPYRTLHSSSTVEVTHVLHGFSTGATVTISGSNKTGGIVESHLDGSRTITVVNDNVYTFVADGSATESVDGGGPNVKYSGANVATRDWSEQAFSSVNGYPGAVCFHEGRLWFGGSGGIPDGLWASTLFQFFNFDAGDGSPIDSIQVTIGAGEISNVRHLVSNNDLQIFTATAEFAILAPRGQGLSPTNVTIRKQTPYGCALVRPLPFDGATLFVQASLTAIREYLFAETTQRYASTNLNVLAAHLLSNPYDMAVLYSGNERNEQYAFLQNDDGTVATFYSARSEQLAGWTTWDQGGAGSPQFKDVAVLGEDVFFVSLRGGVYYLEKMGARSDSIDSATTYTSGTAQNNWVLPTRYRSKTVSVLCDNYYLGDFPVDASGNINVVEDVLNITVGYNYTFTIKTLPVDIDLQTGSTIGLPKRIARVFVGLDSAASLSISGNRLLLRQVDDLVETAPDPVTGVYEFRLLGFQKDAFVELTQEEPLPAVVLGMSMEVQF